MISLVKRKTHEEYVDEVYAINPNTEVIGVYTTNNTKIEHKCSQCRGIFISVPRVVLRQRHGKCGTCSRRNVQKKPPETFAKEFKELVGKEYQLLGEYTGANVPLSIRHNTCNNVFNVAPSNFLFEPRCPECSKKEAGKKRRMSHKEFIEKLPTHIKRNYTILGEYVLSSEKILVRHDMCKREYYVFPWNFIKGRECYECDAIKRRKTHEDFKKEVYQLVGEDYSLSSFYTRSVDVIRMIHNNCNYEYETTPGNFLAGKRCPKCSMSKGEVFIYKTIKEQLIDIVSQYSFENLKVKARMRFDFFVGGAFLLEYDGEGHFEPIDFAGKGEEWALNEYKNRRKRDEIKNQYCIDNEIPLIRIPYWEFDNIESILTSVLMYFDLIERSDAYDENLFSQYLITKGWNHDEYLNATIRCTD